MSDTNKSRKRKILLEKAGYPSPSISIDLKKTNNMPTLWEIVDVYRKNRFIIQLEDDSNVESKIIPDSRIKSFKFKDDSNGDKIIIIEPILTIGEWIEDFLNTNICRIYLLDARGEVVKFFDYDISNHGYEYELDYSDDDILTPKIFYRIF